MWDNLTVKGFQFESSTDFADAKKESDAIDYIVSKMDITDPKIALKVYYKLLDRQNFHTVVGYSFLKQLRDYVINSGIASDDQIRFIVMPSDEKEKGRLSSYGDENSLETDSRIIANSEDIDNDLDEYDKSQDKPDGSVEKSLRRDIATHISREKKLKSVAETYRIRIKRGYCIIAALVIIIIAFFAISIYRGSSPANSIEEQIQNKYAAWADELSNWEQELRIREKDIIAEVNVSSVD